VGKIHYWKRFFRVVTIKMIACKHFVFRYRAIHAERIAARENAAKKEEEDRKKRVVLQEKMASLQKTAETTEIDLPSSGSSKIVPLLASVQKHKKFKRLICKSIDSVTAALNPVRWRTHSLTHSLTRSLACCVCACTARQSGAYCVICQQYSLI
jgi:hypothetical protein